MQSGCPGDKFEGKWVLKKNRIFHHFRTSERKHFRPLANNFGCVVIIEYYVSRGTFDDFFLEKLKILFSPSEYQWRTVNFLGINFGRFVKRDFYVFRGTTVDFFCKSYTFFHHFRNMSEELSTFRRKIFGRLVKIAIWVSRGSFWEITTFLKRVYVLFHHFWTSKYFFKNFVEKTSSWLSKLHFTCPLEGSEQIIFLKNFILIRFRNSSNKFATSGKKLQRGRHNGFLGIQMKVMGKRFIGKKFFMFFLPWPENISTFWQKLFIKVVKKAFYVSWGTCWGVFLEKRSCIFWPLLDS